MQLLLEILAFKQTTTCKLTIDYIVQRDKIQDDFKEERKCNA